MIRTPSTSSIKQALRERIISLRERLSPELRATHSVAICKRLLQLPEYQQAHSVLGYMNFGTEFASEIWIKQVLADGKRLALPRVSRNTSQLELFWVEDPNSQLAPGMWGIREPLAEFCERLDTLNEVEFALLPGVAYARNGARLGYGGGFYDKLLERINHPLTLVSAAFALQIVAEIPQEATDVKVGWIVTEQETISCSAHD